MVFTNSLMGKDYWLAYCLIKCDIETGEQINTGTSTNDSYVLSQ